MVIIVHLPNYSSCLNDFYNIFNEKDHVNSTYIIKFASAYLKGRFTFNGHNISGHTDTIKLEATISMRGAYI